MGLASSEANFASEEEAGQRALTFALLWLDLLRADKRA